MGFSVKVELPMHCKSQCVSNSRQGKVTWQVDHRGVDKGVHDKVQQGVYQRGQLRIRGPTSGLTGISTGENFICYVLILLSKIYLPRRTIITQNTTLTHFLFG